MYSEITSAIQSTKTAIELVKAAHGLSNYSELLTAVTAVQMKLTDAIASELASQEKQAALAEQVRKLEEKIAAIEDWKSQIQRYALFEFPTGALAHKLKAGHEDGEPIHYLCTACVDKKRQPYNQAVAISTAQNARSPLPPPNPLPPIEVVGAAHG